MSEQRASVHSSSSRTTVSACSRSDEAVVRRYEKVLAQLAHHAAEQQREIRALRAQFAATRTTPDVAVDTAALENMVSRMVRDAVQRETNALDDELGRRMAERVQHLTAQHVQKSIDRAFDRAVCPCHVAPAVALPGEETPASSRQPDSQPMNSSSVRTQTTPRRRVPHSPKHTHRLSEKEAALCEARSTAPASFLTPTKASTRSNGDEASPGGFRSISSPTAISPVSGNDVADLYSLSSSCASTSPIRSGATRPYDHMSSVSVADSSPMEVLLSVFTGSDRSVCGNSSVVSACTDRSSGRFRAVRSPHVRSSSVKRDSLVGAMSTLSGTTVNEITREEQSRHTTSGSRSAAEDVAQLIQLFVDSSVCLGETSL